MCPATLIMSFGIGLVRVSMVVGVTWHAGYGLIQSQARSMRNLVSNEGSLNLHERPFSNHHHSKENVHVMMASIIKKDEENTLRPVVKPDLDRISQWVQNRFKFKNFYDQMDFSPKQSLAITNAIIELIIPLGNSNLVKKGLEGVTDWRLLGQILWKWSKRCSNSA